MNRRIFQLLVCTMFLAPGGALADETPSFWDHWGDGRAELNGYRLLFPRYGEMREGRAVAIFVTETFSRSKKVKVEGEQVKAADRMPVLKLNLVKDFQTGIYDYNLMTSAFAGIESQGRRPAGSLAKISFSSQEWCGNVYEELLFAEDEIRHIRHSYFFGESRPIHRIDHPDNGVAEEQMFFLVRDLMGRYLERGESQEVPFMASAERSRILHQPTRWQRAIISRDQKTVRITVPAGTFETDRWQVSPENGPSVEYFVDVRYPHRIVKWVGEDGETAEMAGAARLKYWKLNRDGDERLLEDIGL